MTGKPKRGSLAGEALLDLIVETLGVFFLLRAAGKRMGAVTPWGGGLWGMLRTLELEGPRSVPQIARARPVARQRIQRLADEMAAAGLVEFIDNPAHRRSKLVRLTPAGQRTFRQINERIIAWCEGHVEGLAEGDLRSAVRVLKTLRDRIGAEVRRR